MSHGWFNRARSGSVGLAFLAGLLAAGVLQLPHLSSAQQPSAPVVASTKAPGGTWNCGPCWRRSVWPDLMNTTLGFTCSATEAKASLRSESAATLPAGAGLVVATAGALGC